MLYLVTPTGGRPAAFALLVEYLRAQHACGMPITWIVVDDCDPQTEVPEHAAGDVLRIIRPDWRWRPGMNTQAASLWAALDCVPADGWVAVIEDDDAYQPDHLRNLVAALQSHELVGERVSTYYNVRTRRWREMPGQGWHASLCSVGVRGDALDLLRRICIRGSRRIDMDLWAEFTGAKALLETRNVVGIKGLPGRGGIGVGHRETFGHPDPSGEVLHRLVGADRAAAYFDLVRTAEAA